MKKIYLIPQTTVVKVELSHLVAESYIISNVESSTDAMSKDQGDWDDDLWDD